MKTIQNKQAHWIYFAIVWTMVLVAGIAGLQAQEADNEFSIDAKLLTRGELRIGGFQPDNVDNERIAHFLLGQYQFSLNYKRSWLELKLTPKVTCVWGQSSSNLNLSEAWILLKSKHGLFTQIGRQGLDYDDERILGYDDWVMTAPTHDVIKLGYEGHGHKVHALLAYNQNSENSEIGSTYYSGGLQPYKTMQALWYHYDTPKNIFGISLIGMNIGMQNLDQEKPITYYQQLVGTYMTLRPLFFDVTGSFYYQLGKEEHGIPLSAFMGSVKFKATPNQYYSVFAGYDYLSGDKDFNIIPSGMFGLTRHDVIRGFSPIFGSHHDFYGAMDFFYMDNYVGNFTPGLQNLYIGAEVNPIPGLNLKAVYHFLAIATKLDNVKKPLGHEIEAEIYYSFAKFVRISAGYTHMLGTETMAKLQNIAENRRLHWAWIMLSVSPTIFKATWQDKKKMKVEAVFTGD